MSIAAMKQALEALEEIHPGNMTPMAEEAWNKAITALRLAIEQSEKQEPVAEVRAMEAGGNVGIATVIREIYSHHRESLRPGTKLYTAPPAAQQEQYSSEADTDELLAVGKLPEPLRLAAMLEKTMQWPLHGKAADCLRRMYAAQRQPEHEGCACRWDSEDNRVATCVRHQGWLDVVAEWADRARAAEDALKKQPPQRQPLTDEQLDALMPKPDGTAEADVQRVEVAPGFWGKEYDEVEAWSRPLVREFARAIEAAHGIGGAA